MSLFNLREVKKVGGFYLPVIVSHFWLMAFVVLFLAIATSAFIFYANFYTANLGNIDTFSEVNFRKSANEEILNIWRQNDEKFMGADSKQYKNIFEKVEVDVKETKDASENSTGKEEKPKN